MTDALEVLKEVAPTSLQILHPLKLDRWHRALLQLPEPIYMQYGCSKLLEHVQKAAEGLRATVDLLGRDLPVAPHKLAQRQVRVFRWYLAAEGLDDLVEFQAEWDKDASTWRLTSRSSTEGDVIKSVPDLETAFAKSGEWASELGPPELDEEGELEG